MDNIDIHTKAMDLRYIGLSIGEAFEAHSHRDEGVYEFHLVLEGQGLFYNGDREYPLEPGTLFFSLPEEAHAARSSIPMVLYYCNFWLYPEDQNLKHALRERFLGQAAMKVGRATNLVFEEIRRKHASRDSWLRHSAEFQLLAYLYELLSGEGQSTGHQGQIYINEALNYMQAQIRRDLKMDDLVQRLGIDKSYFIRLFKKTMGTSPLRYYLNLKMDAAKDSLRNSDKPIRTIARELGYEDEFYFSRIFKLYEGISPQCYRKRHVEPELS
ncbi:MAG: AraC family transcriptional regulator [Treponema sp.]|nr:AraC family transcriptional regulator [Treponema sp.]